MDKGELIARLKPIVSTYAQDQQALETIDEDTDFIKDLKINSANLVDVVLAVIRSGANPPAHSRTLNS